MPYKRTGNPPGAPKKDRTSPLLEFAPEGPPVFHSNVRHWWIAMAEMEARLRAEGKWRHGSAKDLARNFTSEKGGAKGKGTVSEARRDPRYREWVQQKQRELEIAMEQQRIDPEKARRESEALQTEIVAAINKCRPE